MLNTRYPKNDKTRHPTNSDPHLPVIIITNYTPKYLVQEVTLATIHIVTKYDTR